VSEAAIEDRCPHWSDAGIVGGGRCAAGRAGGLPSLGFCARACDIAPPAWQPVALRLARQAVASPAGAPARMGRGPGDVVKLVLDRMGYKAQGGCGCEAMRQKMNAWGWWGCWKRREEIAAWFQAKAREAGVEVDGKGVLALLRAAWRELKKPRQALGRTAGNG
jgi:hypothetical protein